MIKKRSINQLNIISVSNIGIMGSAQKWVIRPAHGIMLRIPSLVLLPPDPPTRSQSPELGEHRRPVVL